MRKNILVLIVLTISAIQLSAQDEKSVRIPLIGDVAPSFKAQSTNGEINFPKDFGKEWKILFAHPKDYTPVCSSELLELAQQQAEYKKLGVQLVVLSTDILSQHYAWKKALEEITYKERAPMHIDFPLVADADLSISGKYGMIHPGASTAENIRAVFIIDPDNKIRAINFYPMQVGRNLDEIKRTVIALQTVDAEKFIVTPANWKPGDDVMVPALSQTEIDKLENPDSDVYQVAWFMNFKSIQ
jgi:peroxiredoxin 2/4